MTSAWVSTHDACLTGACVCVRGAAQTDVTIFSDLDLTVLVANQTGTDLLLAISGGAKADQVALPGSMCVQTLDSWGQCTATLSNLDPDETYWIWFISG